MIKFKQNKKKEIQDIQKHLEKLDLNMKRIKNTFDHHLHFTSFDKRPMSEIYLDEMY